MADKKIIGIDFTNNEMRMVQLSGKGKSAVLERYAAGPIPSGVFQGGRIVETARFADVIKELYRTHKFTSKKCIIGISGKYGVTRLIILPKMGAAQTRDAIQLQLNQYVPFPPGDTIFDYKVLREVKEEETTSQEILLAATRRSTLEPLMKAIKMAGLNVIGVKITTLTGFMLFESHYFDAEQAVAFVDVRDQVTDISFVHENYFRLSRSVEFGNGLVVDKVRQKIGGTYDDVEEYLVLNKIDLLETYKPTATVEEEAKPEEEEFVSPLDRAKKATGGESTDKAVRDSVLRVLGAFVNELMRSIRYFESQQKRRGRVGKIVLFGNIGYLVNLKDYIAEQTGLDTHVVESTPETVELMLSGIDLQMYEGNEGKAVVAVSLANEGIRLRRIELNLVPRETVVRKKAFSLMKFVIAGYIVMLAWMAIWYMGKDKEAQKIKDEVAEWDSKITKIKPFYDSTEATKAEINKMAPKVQGVLSIVQKQIAWIPILEELGIVQLPSTWLDEFSMDSNGGKVEIHGYALKTSNVQRFLAVLFYSDVYQNLEVSLNLAGGGEQGQTEDEMGPVGGRTGGAMSAPAPTTGIPQNWTPPKSNSLPNMKWGKAEPMYGLPDLPRGTGEIEGFWQRRNIVIPLSWEFDVSMTVAPQVLDTSSAAFEGLDNLSV